MQLDLVPSVESGRAFLDTPPAEFVCWLTERRQPAMRARQIQRWLLTGRAQSFDQMTDLPASLRAELKTTFVPFGTRCVRRSDASDGTRKLLLRLSDGNLVECVLIPEDPRRT